MADLLWDNPAVSGESQMPLSESDTRAKLLDPALHACGTIAGLTEEAKALSLLPAALLRRAFRGEP